MKTPPKGMTTGAIEAIPSLESVRDPTPGLVLVYSRAHAELPAALAFSSPTTTVGRESSNNLSIPETAVSRFHARFEQRGKHIYVVDLASTNGTSVNGVRVRERKLMAHDLVRMGDAIFRYVASGIFAYGAYRIDGSVIPAARPVRHEIREPLLVGGLSIDLLLAEIDKVARTDIPVVVAGESGTGKELVAREVHRLSERKGPLQAINCAAIPAHLIESELFGFRKGAFTGAAEGKPGLVRSAHGGTLFLDEIGDMPLEAQAKLLRVLQEKEVLPLGATTPEKVDVRFVCATHRNLEALVEEKRFRGDLLARLRGFIARLAPLRERREDLLPLIQHFVTKFGRPEMRPTFSFMLACSHYDWPYNVRELEAAVKLALALSDGTTLDIQHLPESVRAALEGHGEPESERETRTDHPSPPASNPPAKELRRGAVPRESDLRGLLDRHHGNVAAVARACGRERMQVHRWMKRLGIDIAEYRVPENERQDDEKQDHEEQGDEEKTGPRPE